MVMNNLDLKLSPSSNNNIEDLLPTIFTLGGAVLAMGSEYISKYNGYAGLATISIGSAAIFTGLIYMNRLDGRAK